MVIQHPASCAHMCGVYGAKGDRWQLRAAGSCRILQMYMGEHYLLRNPLTFTHARGQYDLLASLRKSYRGSRRSKHTSRAPLLRIAWNVSSGSFLFRKLHAYADFRENPIYAVG